MPPAFRTLVAVVLAWVPSASLASDAAAAHPILAEPSKPASRTVRPGRISPETAAKLQALLPKLPPIPDTPRPPPLPQEGTDESGHAILVLPQFHVSEDRIPQIKERDMLTPEGRRELALKLHPGLRLNGGKRFYDWGGEMLHEEFAKQRQKEIGDLIGLLPAGNASGRKAARELKGKAAKPTRQWSETGGSWAEKQRGGPRGVP